MSKLPCYYVSHGSPTLAVDYGSESYKFFQKWGKMIMNEVKPKSIIIVSAHWETTDVIKVGSFKGETPIIYDFGGFEDNLYRQTYHGQGSPELANKIVDLLTNANLKAKIDTDRGFDHGVWVPLKVAIPDPKDLPIVQVSLVRHGSYSHHIKVGHALASLRNEGALLIGSGTMVHNLRDFIYNFNRATTTIAQTLPAYIKGFDKHIEKLVSEFKGSERDKKFIDLIDHPHLRNAHPTDDHLVPIHVIAGAAGDDKGKKIYEEFTIGLSMSAVEFYEI